jgi:hypothetical protein
MLVANQSDPNTVEDFNRLSNPRDVIQRIL